MNSCTFPKKRHIGFLDDYFDLDDAAPAGHDHDLVSVLQHQDGKTDRHQLPGIYSHIHSYMLGHKNSSYIAVPLGEQKYTDFLSSSLL